jgi:ubiquinone/menaquinone biosynthesis C-methylase UbiE
MNRFKDVSEEDSDRVNGIQADYFTKARNFFDPPYPEGVPERLEIIAASARICHTDTVVDIGTGTGVLIPLIQAYSPSTIHACDLSEGMLAAVKERYPHVHTHLGGIGHLLLPDSSVDVFFINACYPNLTDKHRIFLNIARMIRPGGRIVISHPMGRRFTEFLKRQMPFPVDHFPDTPESARDVFEFYGFNITKFVDDEFLYILLLESDS